jgi:hypothetical protein
MDNSDDKVDVTFKKDYVLDHIVILIFVLFLQIGLIIALGMFISYQAQSFVPKPIFFKTTANRQIIEPKPLDEAVVSAAAVLNLAVEAMRVSYSFNYHSMQNHLTKISRYFDKRGLDQFFEIMANDPNMKQVQVDKLIVSIQAVEAPRITKEGIIEGRYTWLIVFPVSISYKNSTVYRKQDIKISLYIWRAPETEAPIGLQITSINIEE